jgi:hypothetical protein
MTVARRKDDELRELRQALASLPLRDGEREFAKVAGAFLKRHEDRFRFSGQAEPLSEAEAEALASVGVDPGAGGAGSAPVLQAAANHAALAATALPIAEVARRLGVTDGRLRQRVADGSLKAVHGPDGRALRIPAFQLTETGELPGLRLVLRAIRRDLKPIQVAAFFTTPQPDLEDEGGEPMTPVAWLLAGNDPTAVRELAQGL